MAAVIPDALIFNLLYFGKFSLLSAAPMILRIGFHLLAGFFLVTGADKIINWLEQRGSADAS
jgi:hypothetical protein